MIVFTASDEITYLKKFFLLANGLWWQMGSFSSIKQDNVTPR